MEFALTHFTHVFGYLFIVLMVMLRVYLFRANSTVPSYFDSILLWFILSYVKTGPQYDGLCMLINVYNNHLYVFVVHYGMLVWIVVTRVLDAFLAKLGDILETPIPLLHPKWADPYLWLLLMMHPLIHSLVTCIPLWDFPILLMRIAIFAFIYGVTEDTELAPVALVLHDKALVTLIPFLIALNFMAIVKWAEHTWENIHTIRSNLVRLGAKVNVIVFKKEKDEEDTL